MSDAAQCKVHANEIEHLQRWVDDHEKRLRDLERATWRMTAMVSLAASLCSALGAVLAKLIGG